MPNRIDRILEDHTSLNELIVEFDQTEHATTTTRRRSCSPVERDVASVGALVDPTSSDAPVGVIFVTDAFGAQIGHLVGDFNDWSTEATPMELVGELFQVTIPLRPGKSYSYRYLLDGERWQNDLHADDYRANEFGGHDSVRIV